MAFVIAVTWEAAPGQEDQVADILFKLQSASLAEPGVTEFSIHRDLENPAVFFLYEVYPDRAAHETHMQTDHFKSLVLDTALPMLVRRERLFLDFMKAPS